MRTAAAFRLCALCLLLALCVGFLPACEQGAPPPPTSTPEPTPTPAPDPTPSPFVPYDFCRPAPESEEVENSWFSDAVFIGDSRTDG
ncbi:MAG: hypothetical protein GX585_02830, partial [Clostridiales bacterium]|nr:hypothetical protein [Clostridiales bacterium]